MKDAVLAESASSPARSGGPGQNRGPGAGNLGVVGLVTVVSAIVLVAAEFLALGIAAGWAVAGLLELGNIAEYILMSAFGLLGLWATVRFARGAWRQEAAHRRA